MKTYTEEELKEILRLHQLWLNGDSKGVRASLSGANLFGANLSGANLSWANLFEADLSGVDLYGANLFGANLSGANLSWANLFEANLFGANLFGANLFGANLYGANLSWVKGIVRVGPSKDGYEFLGVDHGEKIMIKAGCRWFTLQEAKRHWEKTRGGTKLGKQRLMFVQFIEDYFAGL